MFFEVPEVPKKAPAEKVKPVTVPRKEEVTPAKGTHTDFRLAIT